MRKGGKEMKKILSIFLALCLCVPVAFALAGCGKKKSSAKAGGLYDYDGNIIMSWAEIKKQYPTIFADGGKTIVNPNNRDDTPLCGIIDEKDGGLFVVDSSVTKIDNYAFFGMRAGFDIPASVKYIGDYAFAECNNMDSILIRGLSFDYFGSNVFYSCRELRRIYIGMTRAQYEKIKDSDAYDGLRSIAEREEEPNLFFYSETKAAEYPGYKSWHYDENGKPDFWEYK